MTDRHVTLTAKEREFIRTVLSDYTYQIKGRVLIPYGSLLASILAKLEEETQEIIDA